MLTGSAALLHEVGNWPVLETVPAPKQPSELLPGEVLVKLSYTGVCHSDLHFILGEYPPTSLPCVAGHEGVGHVVSFGEHTIEAQFEVGDRVGVMLIAQTCKKCELCLRGDEHYCSEVKYLGLHQWGTFSEYVVTRSEYLVRIPEAVSSPAAAPILCAGFTVYSALKNSDSNAGEWIAISGAGGGLGHLAIQYANAMGLRVIAIDSGEDKKSLCLSLGAEKWVDFKASNDVVADVRAAADGLGPHVALVAAGINLPYIQAAQYLRQTGRLLCIGLPSGNAEGFSLVSVVVKGIKLIGSALGSRQEGVEALDFVARGKVRPHFEVYPHRDINTVLGKMNKGEIVGRAVLKY
ncbi:hypothetical protein CERSUDRAFT_84712 [Gelatoporia subvermispora B]|uniref:Enoyl reductase (ER) domain-containing protein n=1 Tax=Ceriporiopsis subvermispora (strain B) TaxID=914234 RepID=M2RCK2_CERS8|nr:hypothetical protein CERSUDRAFT_84712 [Gelatoporia subvermispora B]